MKLQKGKKSSKHFIGLRQEEQVEEVISRHDVEEKQEEAEAPQPMTTVGKKKFKKLISGSKEAMDRGRGVVYFAHIPHGFYEDEMQKFLAQFGTVTNLHLVRSSLSGRSKGYAFVEFRYAEVAKIVAETMNNHLMMHKILKCEVVPNEKVRSAMFRGKINPVKPPKKKSRLLAKKQVNANRDDRQELKRSKKQLARLMKMQGKLKDLGLDCSVDFSVLKTQIEEAAKNVRTDGGKTPVMQVDDSDGDITLKTPPNVRKLKSRSNSAANSASGTPTTGNVLEDSNLKLSKLLLKKKLGLKASTTALNNKGKATSSTPKSHAVTPDFNKDKTGSSRKGKELNKSVKKEKPLKATPKNTPSKAGTPKSAGKRMK